MSGADGALENDVDQDLKLLAKFVNLDASKVQSVIDEFNTHGPNVTYNTIAEITGLDPELESINIRDTLALVIHYYVKHKGLFEESLSNSKVDKKIVEDVRNLIGLLNEKGLKGLDMLYAVMGTEGSPTLKGIDYNLMLSEILDEDKKQMGYLPLLQLKLELLNGDAKDLCQSIFMTLEDFDALMKNLKNIQDKFLQSAREFRRQLGDSVILLDK